MKNQLLKWFDDYRPIIRTLWDSESNWNDNGDMLIHSNLKWVMSHSKLPIQPTSRESKKSSQKWWQDGAKRQDEKYCFQLAQGVLVVLKTKEEKKTYLSSRSITFFS